MKRIRTYKRPTSTARLRRFIRQYRPVFEALSRGATPFGSSFFITH